jgi:protein gp37
MRAKQWGEGLWAGNHRIASEKTWHDPFRWKPGRVFCGSMCDIFEPAAELDPWRERLWATIEMTPHLTWQLLTKRPEQIPLRVPVGWMADGFPDNVWVGTTVENQAMANLRMPRLARIPARVRFLSCEPLLGPVDLKELLRRPAGRFVAPYSPIHWIIVGGESGSHRRPFDEDWARQIRNLCAAAGVAFFYKQTSAYRPGQPGPDDLMIREFPCT